MKNKCVWTDTNTFTNSQNKPGGGEHGWRVTELLCSLAASTPLLPLTTNQKNCFLACQDPGMKSMNCPWCWTLHRAAGFSQFGPHSCGRKGHTMAFLPYLSTGPRKEQWDKGSYLPGELLASGALRPESISAFSSIVAKSFSLSLNQPQMYLKTITGRNKITSCFEQPLPAPKEAWESHIPPADRLATDHSWVYNLAAHTLCWIQYFDHKRTQTETST